MSGVAARECGAAPSSETRPIVTALLELRADALLGAALVRDDRRDAAARAEELSEEVGGLVVGAVAPAAGERGAGGGERRERRAAETVLLVGTPRRFGVGAGIAYMMFESMHTVVFGTGATSSSSITFRCGECGV